MLRHSHGLGVFRVLLRSLNCILQGADKIQKKYKFISPGNTVPANRGIGRAMDRPPWQEPMSHLGVKSLNGLYTAGRLA